MLFEEKKKRKKKSKDFVLFSLETKLVYLNFLSTPITLILGGSFLNLNVLCFPCLNSDFTDFLAPHCQKQPSKKNSKVV